MDRVIVAGGGAMGSGIACIVAKAGYDVDLIEPDPAARARAVARVHRAAEKAGDATLGSRVHVLDAIAAPSAAVLAIEAVPERADLKRDVLAALANAVSQHTPIATNTSSLSVTALASRTTQPERIFGLHFFNPPEAMQLVEVVPGDGTAEAVVDFGLRFAEAIGKTAVLARDTPGFIVNRVARPFYLQAMRALERGAAPVNELDALARGAGFRMGPFELMDLIGLDVNLATTLSVYERSGAERLAPVAMQGEMVARGRLGRKAPAGGFYEYAADGSYARYEAKVAATDAPVDDVERIAVTGFGRLAAEFAERLDRRFAHVNRIERDDVLDELALDATLVVDAGDGSSDRDAAILMLDGLLGPDTVLLADAYTTDLAACARRMQHPERLAGYGVLGSLDGQDVVEIVDSESVSDDALALAQDVFGALGKGVVLVEDVPGLFLGRTIGSIVNEAMIAVQEDVATPDDVDVAMRLGTNYPIGPIAWGREIGGARLTRVLRALAAAEGDAFAPHRSLWVLDADDAGDSDVPVSQGPAGTVLPG